MVIFIPWSLFLCFFLHIKIATIVITMMTKNTTTAQTVALIKSGFGSATAENKAREYITRF